MKQFIKLIQYGWLLDYHIKKKNKFNSNHKTVLRFHYEMSLHYYEKIYGKPFDR